MHHHHHDHDEHHHHAIPSQINRTFALGIALNIGFVIIEAFYGWQANALALLADAGHNLSDVAGLLLAWLGMRATQWPANNRHTYGWKRLSIMASLVNALILLVGMSYLIYEAIIRFNSLHALNGETVMWVAGAGILINGLTAWLFLKQGSDDLNIRAAFLHMLADALVSVAVVVSGALVLWFGINWLDSAISLIIAGVVIAATWSVFTQSLHLSFDGVPHAISLEAVRKTLLNLPQVHAIHDLHIWAMSTQENALTVHLVYLPETDTEALLSAAHEVLAHHFAIQHSTIQLEPEHYAVQCAQKMCKDHTLAET